MMKLTSLVLILILTIPMTACNSDGSFSIDEIGPTLTEAGETVNENADAIDEQLGGSPEIDAIIGPEVRRGTATTRLLAELLLLGGALFYRKKAKSAEAVVDEIDANPETPDAIKQVSSRQAFKDAKKIVA